MDPPLKDSIAPAWAFGQVRALRFSLFVILALLLLIENSRTDTASPR